MTSIYTYAMGSVRNATITGFLLTTMNLNESYVDLSFDRDNVFCSLNAVYLETNDKSKREILDELNDDFLNIGIMFLENDNAYKTNRYKYQNAGIRFAEYDVESRFIKIYVSDEFIFHFLNKDFEEITDAIMQISSHEDTHRQQVDRSNNKVKGLRLNNYLQTQSELKEYYSNPTEIDAHAAEFARYLYNKDLKSGEIVNLINNQSKSLLECTAYKQYWDMFGIITRCKDKLDKDGYERLHVWKRFIKRTVVYLQSTFKYHFGLDESKVMSKLNIIK